MSVLPTPVLTSAQSSVGAQALRKASWHLLPLISLGYGTAYMDRVNISFAALQMNQDLHFSATMYGLGAGLFFLSYAACEIPSNQLLLRFGARRWLARIMLSWGILAVAMMLVRTPVQFYVLRFLLGAAEAGFFPGVLYYLMQWFPPGMRARAISRFYIALPLSSVVMGSLAGFLLGLNGRLGLAGWQWLFLVEGLPAIALSLVFLRLLPDTPAEANWLTPAESAWLIEQVRLDAAAGLSTASTAAPTTASAPAQAHQPMRSLRDRRVWLLGLLCFCMLTCTYAYALSAPAIIARLTGFRPSLVGALIAVTGLLGAAAMLANSAHSDRTRESKWHVVVPFVVMAAAFLAGGSTEIAWLAVPALAITAVANSAVQGPLLATPSTFLKGTDAAPGLAAMNMIGMLGGFVGPYWMGFAKDLTGNYQRGLITLALPALSAAAIMLYLHRHQG